MSDNNPAVIVFSFPEPENSNGTTFPLLLEKARSLFTDIPEVKVHLAISDAAKEIMNILVPEE
jgi:hypothetical protein